VVLEEKKRKQGLDFLDEKQTYGSRIIKGMRDFP
jgi:hypothetical protein